MIVGHRGAPRSQACEAIHRQLTRPVVSQANPGIITYTSKDLRALRPNVTKIPRDVRKTIFSCGIWKPRTSKLRATNHKSNLVHLDKASSKSTNKNDSSLPINLVTYNARSAMAKPLAINEFITANDIDILNLNETWIQQSDEAKIKEMCPINYSFYGKSRNGRGGGVGIVIRDNFPIK